MLCSHLDRHGELLDAYELLRDQLVALSSFPIALEHEEPEPEHEPEPAEQQETAPPPTQADAEEYVRRRRAARPNLTNLAEILR